ncbi:PP2C family serine/threonine-protein phosphatase [Methylocystis sp. SC2]|uniref:PP2C family protein-serine/threonine phosphatase n=1 Tax=Methylocystis sp. (strain SC2) TaxID=187303 RepID=UPI00027AEC98|nr:PP2C family serine/threonine-protein phosphatase [Methylocystis sp. SC2]CCJ07516.1 Protein phosphatase 2C-like protein [Methylocystis sp. SC2]
MTANRPAAPLRIAGAIRTDVGCVRQLNEDSVAFIASAGPAPARDDGALALVADGMGGHAAGEVASALALEVVRRVYYSLDRIPSEALRAAFDAANRAIFDYAAQHPDCAGMGTTCTALGVRDGLLWLAHVGDSRAYLMRDGRLTQLSDDQTLHAQLVRDGVMSPEDAGKGAGSNVILQALGTRLDVEPTIWMEGLPLRQGDIMVLCSDGLTNLVSDARIAELVSKNPPTEACRLLIEAARRGGGHDNISVGVFVAETDAADRTADQAATKRINVADPPTGALTAKIDATAEG